MTGQLTSYDPSNGESLGVIPVTENKQIEQMVANAHIAAKKWRKLKLVERVELIDKAYTELELSIDEMSVLLSREMGKDILRSTGEVRGTVYGSSHLARAVMAALESTDLGQGTLIEYKALGVAAVISPWNYPLAMANNLIVPALVAGNAVVFKPSEETPLIAQAFVEKLNKVLPHNLFQIVYGDGEQGQTLVESDVNLIAFTGSQAVGKQIMATAAGNLKRLVMELGGNDPMIVMEDANLGTAVRFAVASSFENAGQMCVSTERIYVDNKIADTFEQQVAELASVYETGPWDMVGVNIGPIINDKQHDKILEHIRDAEEKGARVLLGGSNQKRPYIYPTVISDMTPDMKIEQQETFGPVIAICRYFDVKEAIRRANDSTYGLGAVVFGGAEANHVADQLEAGMIGVNHGVGGSGDAPWVGAKQSGFGFHGSVEGHRQFAQVRVLSR
jgi:acyl-CoA reductase-like NAD-dependent aldehyde dehydrogenase